MMESVLIVFILGFVWVEGGRQCSRDYLFSEGLIYRGGDTSSLVSFAVDSDIKNFTIEAIPYLSEENGTECWVDMTWDIGSEQRRLSFHEKVSLWHLGGAHDQALKISISQGRCFAESVAVRVFIQGSSDSVVCTVTTEFVKMSQPEATPQRTRSKRSLNVPKWVSLSEIGPVDFIFVWPLKSRFDVDTLALAAGNEVGRAHQYLILSDYERHVFSLFVPGVHVSGPTYGHEITQGFNYQQGRQLFKYSKIDAAWVLWNYEHNKPVHVRRGDSEYWKWRTCTVPIQQPGLVFDHTEH